MPESTKVKSPGETSLGCRLFLLFLFLLSIDFAIDIGVLTLLHVIGPFPVVGFLVFLFLFLVFPLLFLLLHGHGRLISHLFVAVCMARWSIDIHPTQGNIHGLVLWIC